MEDEMTTEQYLKLRRAVMKTGGTELSEEEIREADEAIESMEELE